MPGRIEQAVDRLSRGRRSTAAARSPYGEMSVPVARLSSMCGRYASSRDPSDLVVEFEIAAGNVKESVQELPDNFNVAPTDQVIAVVERKNREQPDQVVRKLTTVKWGLVPSWAKDTSI